MIVECKKLFSPIKQEPLESSPWLNVDKQYVVLAMTNSTLSGCHIYIQTENHEEPRFISLTGFEIISQKIPSNWITQIEEIDGKKVITMLPEKWNYESFFEDVDDEKPEAVVLFAEEAKKIYLEEGWYYE